RPYIRTPEQRLAEGLHGDHQLETAAAGAPGAFGQEGAERPQLCQFCPGFPAEARLAFRQAPLLGERPVLFQQSRQALAEDPLVFAEEERPLTHSPSTALATMLRWISLEPP